MVRNERYPWCGALVCATVFLASAVGFAADAQAGALSIGPVEHVNLKSSTIIVLGQTYHLSSSVHLTDKATQSAVALRSITPGTLVVVDGAESASGKITVQNVVRLPQLDVPGATQLLVTGIVSGTSNIGRICIGGLSVDINATLTSDARGAAVGELVQVVGTQPTSGGIFLAQGVSLSTGIIGSGSSANGIIGSGSSANGIIGSGSNANGIIGSGSNANGIIGSGSNANGIIGSGSSANGIIGSGSTANGIIGSGSSANGIIGSGSTSKGIIGSGSTSNGIIGSGSTANGIIGSGASL